MKKYVLLALYALSFSFIIANHTLEIMSYNARRKGKDPEEFQWDTRKKSFFELILSKNPDIIGFQEVVKGKQFKDIKKALSDYKSFGDSRNEHATLFTLPWLISKHWDAQDECNPIFYNPQKVKLISSGTFGINSSFFSKQLLPRICTWGIFENKKTKKQFYVFNTHLDNASESVRNEQLNNILNSRKIGKLNQDIPAILTGDLNTKIEGDIKKIFTEADFVDAKEKAKIIKGPQETRTGWRDKELKDIDHILVKDMDVEEYEVIKNPEGTYPSDHRPVIAKIVR